MLDIATGFRLSIAKTRISDLGFSFPRIFRLLFIFSIRARRVERL